MNKLLTPFLIIFILIQFPAVALNSNSGSHVKVLIADNPQSCLSLESFTVTDDGYWLIDTRNNTARVKFIDDTGTVIRTGVSTIPLPDAASLPADVLPTPWGLDRVAFNENGIWAVPSIWSGAVAEKFNLTSGDFIERIPDPGLRVSGMINGPHGDVWAVGQRILYNVSSGNQQALNLSGSIFHIDTAVGHPLGFLIYEQPDLLLIDSNEIIRWRINLDGVLDYFISPLDIATGPDGSIVIGAVLCDLTDEEYHEEYYSVRGEQLRNDYEEGLFILEDTLRYELAVGFALIMIDPDGTITEVKEMGTAPTSVAIDSIGRYHVLSQEDNGWGIYIWDPRLDMEIEVAHIPMGEPALISPHRIASGRDGSIYWDDLYAGETDSYWGIAKYQKSDSGGLFSLGSDDPSGYEWIIREPLGDSIMRTTSLEVTDTGDLWVGLTEFPLTVPDENEGAEILPYNTYLRRFDRSGNLLLDLKTDQLTGADCNASDLLYTVNGIVAVLGGTDTTTPFGSLDSSGIWTPSQFYQNDSLVAHARIDNLPGKIIAWMMVSDNYGLFDRWVIMDDDMSGPYEIELLEILGCNLLATDSVNGKLYLTIDDGEIFRLDASSLYLEGLWSNRLPSGAPAHSLEDAAFTADGLVILDREHRAIIQIDRDCFVEPPVSITADVNDAVGVIRVALSEFKSLYGIYPPDSPGLLNDILSYNEIEIVKRAFIGERIYNYKPTEIGYSFVVWSAAADHPVLLCSDSDTLEYN